MVEGSNYSAKDYNIIFYGTVFRSVVMHMRQYGFTTDKACKINSGVVIVVTVLQD